MKNHYHRRLEGKRHIKLVSGRRRQYMGIMSIPEKLPIFYRKILESLIEKQQPHNELKLPRITNMEKVRHL